MENKQGCSGVEIGEDVHFDMIISVPECVTGSDNNYNFNIEVRVSYRVINSNFNVTSM